MKRIQKHTLVLFSILVFTNSVQLISGLVSKKDNDLAIKGINEAGYVLTNISPAPLGTVLISVAIYLILLTYINRNSRKAAIIYFIFMLIALFIFAQNFASLGNLETQVSELTKISDETFKHFQNVVLYSKISLGLIITAILVSAIYTFSLIKKFKKTKEVSA